MNIKLIAIGKTDSAALQQLISTYEKRLVRYINFELQLLADIKNSKSLTEELQKIKEGELILSNVESSHYLILLDERGKEYTSVAFADELQKKMNTSIKQLTFVIGGPYGFSQEVYNRANGKLSLSKLTFSHQMIRLFFIEQLYRAFTILRNEPYHHQ
ncbi:putative rRNA large subunit m3Psi methyltransferase RlmH [Capnocytophaga sp. oral taxon 332 str. F0381]|uniref:23S rRNA (pseudouridine(1915)-N(3))-methyltransferase RlmH n=1 Tax=Capnocytophaga sp. oral taxon 332 TaxID=712213 RepID=UPI0002A3594C|nr:23S rRNA (pseudouridine(1915)-N(3))-methyltransferase RlmH [Capnocytophaga sp. oral taxon 332]EKY09136.1 putative rRNA large subunit m3Psi methyltransferase RlmH [Capnocytophaga sp. oral taxon 332 str. F0381]